MRAKSRTPDAAGTKAQGTAPTRKRGPARIRWNESGWSSIRKNRLCTARGGKLLGIRCRVRPGSASSGGSNRWIDRIMNITLLWRTALTAATRNLLRAGSGLRNPHWTAGVDTHRRTNRRYARSDLIRGAGPYGRLKLSILCMFCVLSTACAPVVSTEELRYTDNPNNYSITVEKDYQSVHQHVLDMGRKCHHKLVWTLYPIPNRMVVDGKLNKFQQTGYVSFSFYPGIVGDAATIAVMVVDVALLSSKRTKVTVYSHSAWNQSANAVRNWIEGNSQDCVPTE